MKGKMYKIAPWLSIGLVLIILAAAFGSQNGNYNYGNSEVTSQPAYSNDGDFALFAAEPAFESGEKRIGGFADDSYYEESPSGEQSVIKTGNLTITVHHADETAQALDDVAKKYGGAVTNRSINQYEGTRSGYVTLTVEESQFETAILEIKALALTVENETVNAQDVTETVIDLEARLKTAIAEEVRYTEILSLANTVDDVLNVERNLARVRSTIESYQSQLNYYEQKTSFSTITVSLSEETSIEIGGVEFRPGQEIINAAQTVVELFQEIVVGLIYIVIVGGAVAVPVLIILAIIHTIAKSKK